MKTTPNLKEKALVYENYFEESNINWKPLISSQDVIITKFGQKKKNGCAEEMVKEKKDTST